MGKGKLVAAMKAALCPNQFLRVSRLLEALNADELDMNFERSLAQLKRAEAAVRSGVKETVTIAVFVKRHLVLGQLWCWIEL